MIVKLEGLGGIGIVADAAAYQLPPNAWTSGQNVRFQDGKVVKFKGHSEYYDTGLNWDNGTGEQIYYLLPVSSGASYYWIYCGLKDVRVTDGSTDKQISSASGAYSASDDIGWTGGIISGIPVLNNGVNNPQMWSPIDYGTPGLLADITAWPASTTCRTMRVYKNYLIALDVTKSGARYPNMVKWSDGAGLGAVPASWDETDPTTDAGENDLAESRSDSNLGAAMDCMPLRDANIVYTDSSVWSMNFVGGSFIFQFRELLQNQGIINRRCVAEFNGNHFVVGQSDVYVHNGSTAKSVIDNRMKRYLFNAMDGNEIQKTFVFANYTETEMWVCYVESGHQAALPSQALVWNWSQNTWGVRDLPNSNTTSGFGTAYIDGGIANTAVATPDTWDQNDGTWDTWTVAWGDLNYTPQAASPMIGADKLYKGNDTDQFDGTSFTSSVERLDIPLGEQDEVVRIKNAYPRMKGNQAVNIYIGSQSAPGAAVNYSSAKTFTPGTDHKIDVRLTGTHGAVKVESTGNQAWELTGLDLEIEKVGNRP